jgi:biopolymer transport protein ExbD
MGAKISGDSEDPIADINIVPFVDIILVVLIIFMVTTPLIMKNSIPVNLPKAASGSDTTPSQLNISISKDGRTMMNGKIAEDPAISEFALTLVKDHPDTQAIISADREVPHGRVMTVIDLIKTSGISKFAISTDKK